MCLVIAIADGDTLTASCEGANGMENIKVRLAEIDAPEKGQAFGARSRQRLAELCFQKQATVTPRTKDRYLRMVANVDCQGVDAGTEQVRAGMAWVFTTPLQPVVPSHSGHSEVQDSASGGHAEATARALRLPNAAQTLSEKLRSCCCLGPWISAAET
jgi:endonuclease YncB( thermonuclease family)